MAYYVYFNRPNRKVKIHKGSCRFCNEGKGLQENVHGEFNGGWRGHFSTYEEAYAVAQTIGGDLGASPTDCARC